MYSYEERIRAVKLYIKLGKRTGPTIRQLGYPTKNSLKDWYREYERDRDLQVVYTRSRLKYTAEQIQVAVQHYLDHDRCIAYTLRALAYPCRELLTAWIDEFHPEVRRRIVGRTGSICTSSPIYASQSCQSGGPRAGAMVVCWCVAS